MKKDTQTWRSAKIYAEWNDNTYDGQISDQHWNGWVIPRFNRQVAERIVTDQELIHNQYPESDKMEWDGDTILVTNPAHPNEPFRIQPVDGWYYIGDSWTWTEA